MPVPFGTERAGIDEDGHEAQKIFEALETLRIELPSCGVWQMRIWVLVNLSSPQAQPPGSNLPYKSKKFENDLSPD